MKTKSDRLMSTLYVRISTSEREDLKRIAREFRPPLSLSAIVRLILSERLEGGPTSTRKKTVPRIAFGRRR